MIPRLFSQLRPTLFHWLCSVPFPRLWFCRQPYDLVIFKPDAIGDFVLASGAIRLLCAERPRARIGIIATSLTAPLIRHYFPNLDVILTHPFVSAPLARHALNLMKDWLRFGQIRCRHLVSLRHIPNEWECLLLHWLRADSSWGVDDCAVVPLQLRETYRFRYSFTHTPDLRQGVQVAQECRELWLSREVVTQYCGRKIEPTNISPFIPDQPALAITSGYILVAPFGSAVIRDYPEGQMARVLTAVLGATQLVMVLTGTREQQPRLLALFNRVPTSLQSRMTICCDKTIVEYFGVVARSRVVLAVESATAHIATALDKPTIVLLGGGHYGRFAPWYKSDKQIWLTNPLSCYGCYWHCIRSSSECLENISPGLISQVLCQINSDTAVTH